MSAIRKFILDQLSVWPLAASNFRSMKAAATRTFDVGGLEVTAQYNPERITSSTAETDESTIGSRPCFLCPENRPQEQFHIRFEGRKGRSYNVQLNPYPIFPDHLVIVRSVHVPQSIAHVFVDAMDFCRANPGFLVFYNGPFSGASAPDHHHFQACHTGALPLQKAADVFLENPGVPLATNQDASLYHFDKFTRGIYVLDSATPKSLAKLFYRLLDCAPVSPGEPEPRFNLYTYCSGERFRAIVVLRSKLRSHHYCAEGDEHLTMSPGAADMGGVFVVPVESDFRKLSAGMLESMVDEVVISAEDERKVAWRLSRKQRKIDVGIMSAPQICFEIISDGAGPQKVIWKDGRIEYCGALYDELFFDRVSPSTLFAEPSFILYDVPIGKGFHWEKKMDQKFAGSLKFIVEGDRITAINHVGIENYLVSVISSEMKASSPLELLKAHAIISRSWLLSFSADHENYDVCADDHCQRYQGLSLAIGENARRAIDETWGKVLEYDGELCDTRYSKCCGGTTEVFSTCWEDRELPYLRSFADPYCAKTDPEFLSTVLNDYDLPTGDFLEWKVEYGDEELSELLRDRTGVDFGRIEEMEALRRGPSGRIMYLRIRGTKAEKTIGKELEIRRALSRSHLKSSNFEVERGDGVWILRGRGWGHGVGLCQIGAAQMAREGFGCEQILDFYYPGAKICEK